MRIITRIAGSIVLLLLSAVAYSQPSPKHIVFLSGPPDHRSPGRHDYEGDLRVLQDAFDKAPNIPKVKTSFYLGKAPDAKVIADADVIVIESSSDRDANEQHPLFPPDPSTNHHGYDDATKAYLQGYDELMKKGVGIVILHYASWAENWAARQYYINWTGGLWVQMMSKNPVDQWTMLPVNTTHPVLNGIKQWTYRDEVFSRFFLPDDYRRTNLLIGTPEQDTNHMGPQVTAWAYQRDEGGRAFVFGGVDFHDNMLIDVYRRFILNGIYWAAHGNVPNGGINSETPKGIEPYVAPALAPSPQRR